MHFFTDTSLSLSTYTQSCTYLRQAERRLGVQSMRMQRLHRVWQRYGHDLRASSLSQSREVLYLQDQVKAQADTIQRLMWQLAAKDAEANYLRTSLASAQNNAPDAAPPHHTYTQAVKGGNVQSPVLSPSS